MQLTGMKAVIVGSGSAMPDPDRGNPSQAIVIDDEVLLFDCGERTTAGLARAGLNPLHVNHLFFTHLHWDHMSDYGYFVITGWACGRDRPLLVYGPDGTRKMSDAMVYGGFHTDIEFIKRYVRALPPHITHRPTEAPVIEITEIAPGFELETDRFKVIAGGVEHHQRVGTPSVAFRVESRYGTVAISGDTRPCDGMIELARGADLLIHEAAFLDEIIEARQMWSHSGPSGAGRVAREAGVGRLVLTHLGPYTSTQAAVDMAAMYYGPRRGPEVWDKILADARREFPGPVTLGHDGLVIDIGGDV